MDGWSLLRRLPEGIITFGSPVLVQSLTNAGLIDEYHILLHPVIVGEGGRLFANVSDRKDLRRNQSGRSNGARSSSIAS